MRSSSTSEDDCSPAASADVRCLCSTMALCPLVVSVPHHRRPHRTMDSQVRSRVMYSNRLGHCLLRCPIISDT